MYYSPAHNVVVYHVANPAQVVASIEGARAVNGSMVAVPASLFSLQLARVLGLPAPGPLDIDQYDWPSPTLTPFVHQRAMANFMVLHPRCFNLSQMRTGKTMATLWAADYLMREGAIRRALIISPLSTLQRVWGNSIFQHFLGSRTYTVLHGDSATRLERLQQDHDFYIINHDGFKSGAFRAVGGRPLRLGRVAQALADRPDIDLVIVDEASAYRNATSLRSKILQRLLVGKPYVWRLTGTPTPRAPTDAYGLIRLTDNRESFTSFRARTMRKHPYSLFRWEPVKGADALVHQALQPAIRFSRAECIDLPPPEVETIDVPLSKTQAEAYATLKRELALTMKDGKQITAMNEAVLRTKLIQVACGAVYGPNREVLKTDCEPRLDALKEAMDEAGGKILVFAPFTSVVDLLYSELKETYGGQAVDKVYGDTPPRKRDEVFQAFAEDPTLKYIVADPRTMAHGLDLSSAATIIWFAPVDDLEIYEQASARIDGPLQKNKMLILRLASTPVERAIFQRLAEKQTLQGAILGLVEDSR